jgi:hypothetical protein
MWKDFSESLEEAYLAFVFWALLVSLEECDDSYIERREFWEQLSHGWMQEYIYPYDDIFGVVQKSRERKMRIGR